MSESDISRIITEMNRIIGKLEGGFGAVSEQVAELGKKNDTAHAAIHGRINVIAEQGSALSKYNKEEINGIKQRPAQTVNIWIMIATMAGAIASWLPAIAALIMGLHK